MAFCKGLELADREMAAISITEGFISDSQTWEIKARNLVLWPNVSMPYPNYGIYLSRFQGSQSLFPYFTPSILNSVDVFSLTNNVILKAKEYN